MPRQIYLVPIHSLFSLPHTLMREEFNNVKVVCDARSRFLGGLDVLVYLGTYTNETTKSKPSSSLKNYPLLCLQLSVFRETEVLVQQQSGLVHSDSHNVGCTLLHLGMKKRISSLVFFWIFCEALEVHSWEQKPLQCWQCASVPGGQCQNDIIVRRSEKKITLVFFF